MKIRSGFVSNSSSSSFIMGLAKVTDADMLNELLLLNEKNIFAFNPGAQPPGTNSWDMKIGEDSVTLEAFTDEEIELTGLKKGDFIMWFDGDSGPDGDSAFKSEDGWRLNYNIELSAFSEEDQEMYRKLESMGGSVLHGAGRDG